MVHRESRSLKYVRERFTDVRYIFSASTQRHERHDRFEQGSYFYVYHNEHSGQARIEIANNAGTPDQDAIEGSESNNTPKI